MRPVLGAVSAGALAGVALYGLLAAASRDLPPPADPWLHAWEDEGLKAQFRSVSTEPERHFRIPEVRPEFEAPEFEGTIIRNYQLMNDSIQVVILPRPDLLPTLPEGRHFGFRLHPKKGAAVHLFRSARNLLVIPVHVKWMGPIPYPKASRQDIERAFDAFEETARKHP